MTHDRTRSQKTGPDPLGPDPLGPDPLGPNLISFQLPLPLAIIRYDLFTMHHHENHVFCFLAILLFSSHTL